MPESKKRKVVSTLFEPSATARTQPSIYSFTRISKAQAAPSKTLKIPIATSLVDILPTASKKRKLSAASESVLNDELASDSWSSSLKSAKRSLSGNELNGSQEATNPKGLSSLPEELQDLIDLDSAFLTALSLHFAHNGTSQPADLNSLAIDVTRVWGRRNVVQLDIIRTIGVQNSTRGSKSENYSTIIPACRLSLSEYGAGKTCIELKDTQISRNKLGTPIDEALLHNSFTKSLRQLWSDYVLASKGQDGDAIKFIEELPRAPIVFCSSLLNISPLLCKGKQRLAEFKTASKVFQKEASKRQGRLAHETGTDTAKSRSKGLEERIRARRLLQTKLPQALSQTQLDRRLALQRLEEVVSVLDILSSSSQCTPVRVSETAGAEGKICHPQRISFTMPTVLGHLRDSMRNPISKDEGQKCIYILGKEVAPQWVVLVQMGQVEAVVLDTERRPGAEELHKRIRLLQG
ncbi:MAG: hypothetical protein M1829_002330 [Trizodia sp. TS-e1964]|nr:MAG: hypothetical protein M1829_002330 [Trizodia sp. TS-e1964]